MPGPPPAVAEIRSALRATLRECAAGDLVLVALSGGADSTALAAATGVEAPLLGLRAGAIIVDHGLHPDSAELAATAADRAPGLGLDPVEIVQVVVETRGEGLEAAARAARYAALDAAADRLGARLVLLGHTLADQAEQVLLGLARGSGLRSLAGMPAERGRYRRPLLGIDRGATRFACEVDNLPWWEDPMNADPAYTRVRARQAVAELERALGPGIAAALARSATQLRADADLIDGLVEETLAGLGAGPWQVAALTAIARPLRTRLWRRLLLAAGAPAGQVSSRHTDACDRLLTHWHGQGPLHLPGDLRVGREGASVWIRATGPVE